MARDGVRADGPLTVDLSEPPAVGLDACLDVAGGDLLVERLVAMFSRVSLEVLTKSDTTSKRPISPTWAVQARRLQNRAGEQGWCLGQRAIGAEGSGSADSDARFVTSDCASLSGQQANRAHVRRDALVYFR